MGGSQRKIYDEARNFLAEQVTNLSYTGSTQAEAIRSVLADPLCYKGNAIQQVKGELDKLRANVDALLVQERDSALKGLAELKVKIEAVPEFKQLDAAAKAGILSECEAAETSVRNAKLVAMVRERTANFRSETYPALLGKVARLATPPAPPAPPATEQPQPGESKGREAPAAGITPQPAPAPSPVEYVSTANLKVSFASPYLASEADVETYLQAYRETLLAEIRSGKRITV